MRLTQMRWWRRRTAPAGHEPTDTLTTDTNLPSSKHPMRPPKTLATEATEATESTETDRHGSPPCSLWPVAHAVGVPVRRCLMEDWYDDQSVNNEMASTPTNGMEAQVPISWLTLRRISPRTSRLNLAAYFAAYFAAFSSPSFLAFFVRAPASSRVIWCSLPSSLYCSW